MPVIKNVGDELLAAYDGYDSSRVGPGLQTDLYRSPAYAKKKIKIILLGTITEFSYGGHDHDSFPLAIPFRVEGAYNTLLSINLNYLPYKARKAVVDYILKSNAARIKSNLPIIVDYDSLKRVVPPVQYVIRRYKQVLVSLGADGGSLPLTEWYDAIKKDSKWNNHWQAIKEGKVK